MIQGLVFTLLLSFTMKTDAISAEKLSSLPEVLSFDDWASIFRANNTRFGYSSDVERGASLVRLLGKIQTGPLSNDD